MRFIASSLVALATVVVAQTSGRLSTVTYPLLQRPLSPASTGGPWMQRGVIHLDALKDEAWLEDKLGALTLEGDGHGHRVMGDGRKYSLALGGDDGEWREVLATPCPKERERIQLFVDSGNRVVHLTHSCSATSSRSEGPQIVVERGVEVPTPQFKEAPPIKVGEDGNVVQPPKPKTFLEKYWMYLLPLAFVIITGGGGGEEPAAKK